MLSFASDYTEGACEEILQKLAETNRESLPGYGMDRYCQSAARKIQEATGCPEAEVYFLVGGTQTNAAVISSMLAPYEGVVAAQTGHVSIHEAGAIEYTGHKVLQLPEKDGKIDPADLQEYLQNFEADANHDHMVFPGMVYLSHPTEYGTLYSRKELQAISEICRSYEIPLYLDGARLGYGLAGEKNDLSLSVMYFISAARRWAHSAERQLYLVRKRMFRRILLPGSSSRARCWQRDACWESSLTCCLQTGCTSAWDAMR